MRSVQASRALFAVLVLIVAILISTTALFLGWNIGSKVVGATVPTQYLRGVYDACMSLTHFIEGTADVRLCGLELQGAVNGAWFDAPSPGFSVPVPDGTAG